MATLFEPSAGGGSSVVGMESSGRQEVPAAYEEKAVDVAIAEFNALRAEIVSYISTQATLVGLALTAGGLIVGFTVKENADQRLLLAIPLLTLLVVLLHTAASYRSAMIGHYIYNVLWKDLERHVGKLSSWEARVAKRRKRSVWKMLPEIFFLDFPAMSIFIVGSAYSMVRIGPGEFLWYVDCVALALAIVVPVGFSLQIRDESGL